MVVERFSQSIINSGIFKLYIATGFFGTLIFFVVNADLFTPIEMIFSIIAITIILKGISNIMLSLIISTFSLDNKRAELEFKHNADKIDALLTDLTIQDAATN
ncbi:MAG: hypothetical protein ACNI3C_07285 [Candidatus Marinarcus sp.]|uniref:hypothetical protein n=1 Tax=Candidatus Marinarcus sp. TaxID=3100987 RepID=UPI003AFF8AE6